MKQHEDPDRVSAYRLWVILLRKVFVAQMEKDAHSRRFQSTLPNLIVGEDVVFLA